MIRSHEHEDVPLNVNAGSVPGVIVLGEADGLMWRVTWMSPMPLMAPLGLQSMKPPFVTICSRRDYAEGCGSPCLLKSP